MKKTYISILLICFFISPSLVSAQIKKLENQIKELIQGFEGDVGIYIQKLNTRETISIQANTIFPTASIVKVPILLGVFDKIDQEKLHFHQPLMYRDSIKYGGSGIMQFFKDSTETDLNTLLALMLSYSDNTTSLWNQALAGGGTEINALMEKLGYKDTRVNSRTPGREKIWEIYGWGQTTPKEMANIFIQIYRQQMISQLASQEMYRLLSNTYYTDNAISQIPPGVNVASKQGMVNTSRSEVILVNSPNGDYVLSLFTKNNRDESWQYDNEGYVLTRNVSHLVWNYFNPEQPYSSPDGFKSFQIYNPD